MPVDMGQGKSERLEARLSSAQKEILQRAADLEGKSITDFVLSAAQDAAKRVIHEHEVLTLSARDREVLVDALLNPPKPNDRMRRAVRRYKEKYG